MQLNKKIVPELTENLNTFKKKFKLKLKKTKKKQQQIPIVLEMNIKQKINCRLIKIKKQI